MTDKYYWPVDPSTQEVGEPVKAMYRGGIHHIPRTALKTKPVDGKDGFVVIAVIDDDGLAIGSELIEDHRDKTVYDQSKCNKFQKVTELGPLPEGWTLDVPATKFDEWINGTWVTNESNKYIAEYNKVDDARRAAYFQVVTPLIDEAKIKRDLIKTPEAIAEVDELEQQALAARQKIQDEHPWPTPPEV
ncbi:hypothetical protein FCV62_14185 [Vibrio kanaloae]|uniref:hypothetical protein n=1 Tax=Vibrio kanaloae TaxID=170673 RepID=UPI0010BE748E|nr:hypothetical protein [Vibrio kanaloae]TKF77905.1 hypothetical protein FCV62_14185 [Vibrio kanaloae]